MNGEGIGEGWVLNHVGMVIEKRDATLRHFQALGVGVSVGPQPLLPHEDGQGALMFWRTLDGNPITNTYPTGGAHNFRDGECQIGDCQLECFPMKPGPGMFINEYLAAKGPGINHVCFNAPQVEEDTHFLVSKGCPLTFNATVNDKTVENYLDTRTHGDLMISLRPPASAWENAWKANNEAHPLVPRWRFLGLGLGVSSCADSVSYYDSLGFPASEDARTDDVLGVRSQSVKVGPLRFEFCEATGSDSVYAASLARRGDGVNDLIFEVADLDAEEQRLRARGVEVLRRADDGRSLFLDTRAEGNIMLRLIQADA